MLENAACNVDHPGRLDRNEFLLAFALQYDLHSSSFVQSGIEHKTHLSSVPSWRCVLIARLLYKTLFLTFQANRTATAAGLSNNIFGFATSKPRRYVR